jgi:hypothetical protein
MKATLEYKTYPMKATLEYDLPDEQDELRRPSTEASMPTSFGSLTTS